MTKIEWCDETINPIVGCNKISAGCANCYAENMARRLAAMGRGQYVRVIDEKGCWNGETTFVPTELEKPSRWKKPRRIFIGSMGDIFHETVWRCWLDDVLEMVVTNPRHTFMMLTKRPQRMKEFFELSVPAGLPGNLWMGVSVENQEAAAERIPLLLQIPAAVHFVSIEPLLGPVDLTRIDNPITGPGSSQPVAPPSYRRLDAISGMAAILDHKNRGAGHQLYKGLDWVIAGPENGNKKRPYQLEWFYSLRKQCHAAGVPFFLKTIDLEGVQVREFSV
ncbi:MAG TPA: phage Gp37/Gp68 family protein [Anaerolineaceae bacterium]